MPRVRRPEPIPEYDYPVNDEVAQGQAANAPPPMAEREYRERMERLRQEFNDAHAQWNAYVPPAPPPIQAQQLYQGNAVGAIAGQQVANLAPAPEIAQRYIDEPNYRVGSLRETKHYNVKLFYNYSKSNEMYTAWSRKYGLVVEATTVEELKEKGLEALELKRELPEYGLPSPVVSLRVVLEETDMYEDG